MSALLEVAGLEVAYGASQVLFGIDLAMAEGEAATLLGRNGMGKTTTLRAICGLEPVKAGRIRFMGDDIAGWRPDRIGRAGIALVPEGRQCFPNLTVDEHLVAFYMPAATKRLGRPRSRSRGPSFVASDLVPATSGRSACSGSHRRSEFKVGPRRPRSACGRKGSGT